MAKVLYEASPSLVRMNPLGTVLALLVMVAGIALALAKGPATEFLAGLTGGLPPETEQVVGIAGIVLFALAFLRLLGWWISTKMDRLQIKDDEVVWTHGLLNRQYTEISMGSVRTVRVSQTLLQRIMNAGDVTIYTSGDLPEVVVRGLPDPRRLRDYIRGAEA
jgi:uncharacterized membrane protein YdbT with pleckstrin-like domain